MKNRPEEVKDTELMTSRTRTLVSWLLDLDSFHSTTVGNH